MLLVIALADIKRLCGILDASQDAVIASLLLAEQPAAEYALDPGLLARVAVAGTDPGALSTLTLGVSELLAGSFLASLGRFPHFAEPLPLAVLVPQAAVVLVLLPADLKRLMAMDPADVSQDVALAALITAEQLGLEYALDPAVLAAAVSAVVLNAGLRSLLTLGLTEQLAAAYLTSLARLPEAAEPLPVSSLNVSAAVVLTVALADVKRLLAVSDNSQDAALTALITAEQLAREYALDPDVLTASATSPGLKALLTLGVAEQIAGSALSEAGRVPGIADDIQISSLHFSTSHGVPPDKLGAELVAQGTARLEPYARLARRRHLLKPFTNVAELDKLAIALAAQGTARLSPFSRHIRAEHALKPVLNQPDLIKLGADLSARGLARLEPYRRAKRSAATQAIGPVPDDYANLVQTSASSVLPGADLGPLPSVFIGAFSDVGDSFTDTLNADSSSEWSGVNGLELDRAEGDGMIWWGQS